MPNSLDPDQARHFVWPDLGPNCLQRLSADERSRQRVNDSAGDDYYFTMCTVRIKIPITVYGKYECVLIFSITLCLLGNF